MKSTNTVVVGVAATAALLALGACGGATTEQAAPPSSVSASTSAPAQAHNEVDAMFAQHMIPHHQQAIEMSDTILGKQGIDPRVTELANQIKNAQAPEIKLMEGWLAEWGMPGMDMPGHSMKPGGSMMPGMSGMPGMGMMSQAEMDQLKNAEGVAATRLFLTQMITHHQGAIDMSQNEVKNGRYQATVELAKSIITSQQKEIDTMKSILSSL